MPTNLNQQGNLTASVSSFDTLTSGTFDDVITLTSAANVTGDRLAIITNGGGAGVMAADALDALGGRLAEFSDETLDRLNALLPASWSKGNPVDILGDASPGRYTGALEVVLQDPDAMLAILQGGRLVTDRLPVDAEDPHR